MFMEAALSPEEPLVHVGQGNESARAGLRTEAALSTFPNELGLRLSVHINHFQNMLRANTGAGAAGRAEPPINHLLLELLKPRSHWESPFIITLP
jgi:hypothetical protein